jgi:putative ABC transport system permease protein
MKIPLIAGRDFTRDDRSDSEPVAIVGEATARRLWPGQSAIGKVVLIADGRMALKGNEPVPVSREPAARTVVGVARDVKYASLATTRPPLFVYVPLSQDPMGSLTLIARSPSGRPITTDLRRLIASLNPDVAITAERTVEQNLAVALLPQRIAATVAGSLGIIGLLLAAFGIYGVMAYAVTRRTREIGIRLALGADRGRVARMLVSRGVSLAAIGAAIGLPLAAVGSGLLRGLLFGVPALDPISFGATAFVVTAVTFAACYVPARRAMRVDPAEALRLD